MTGAPPFRVIDTGLRGGRENIAFDQALIESRAADLVPDTIRFLRFAPSALVGRHQILAHELDLDACAARGIEPGRRITGGGAIYLDPGQIGWELVFHRSRLGLTGLEDAARRICEAAAAGLGALGVAANFRPRNDIEVDGRKLGGTGGFFDGDLLFYQGTMLIDFDAAAMLAALRVPAAKLARHGIASIASRLVTLRELTGGTAPPVAAVQAALLGGFIEHLGIAPHWGTPTMAEETLARRLLAEEIGTDEFIQDTHLPDDPARWGMAEIARPSGSLRVDLCRDHRDHLREVLITGDFFVTPPRLVRDLEAHLRGVAASEAADAVAKFFATASAGFLSLAPGDFATAITAALAAPNAMASA